VLAMTLQEVKANLDRCVARQESTDQGAVGE
jgi:hypothetical protein